MTNDEFNDLVADCVFSVRKRFRTQSENKFQNQDLDRLLNGIIEQVSEEKNVASTCICQALMLAGAQVELAGGSLCFGNLGQRFGANRCNANALI